MKTANWIFSLLFTSLAIVQFNDPDPLVWVLLYGLVAVFFALAALGRLPRRVAQAAFVLILAWAATYIPAFLDWLQMGAPSIV